MFLSTFFRHRGHIDAHGESDTLHPSWRVLSNVRPKSTLKYLFCFFYKLSIYYSMLHIYVACLLNASLQSGRGFCLCFHPQPCGKWLMPPPQRHCLGPSYVPSKVPQSVCACLSIIYTFYSLILLNQLYRRTYKSADICLSGYTCMDMVSVYFMSIRKPNIMYDVYDDDCYM